MVDELVISYSLSVIGEGEDGREFEQPPTSKHYGVPRKHAKGAKGEKGK